MSHLSDVERLRRGVNYAASTRRKRRLARGHDVATVNAQHAAELATAGATEDVPTLEAQLAAIEADLS